MKSVSHKFQITLRYTKPKFMSSLKKAIVKIRVNVSATAVWEVIHDDFANVGNYNPLLGGSHQTSGEHGIGCERQCDIGSRGKTFIKETITKVVPYKHMEVRMSGGQFPMMKMDTVLGAYELEESGDYTIVSLSMEFEAKPKFMGGLLKNKLQKMLFKSMIGLKYYVETGGYVTKENFGKIEKLYYRNGDNASFNSKNAN